MQYHADQLVQITSVQWETSLKSCGQRTQSVVGDKWETSSKSCGPRHSEHPKRTATQVGDKWRQVGGKLEITRAENRECSYRRQLGEKWETSTKSCGPKHSEHPACTGRQVGEKWGQVETSVKSRGVVGDKWETSVKSRRPKHLHHPECTSEGKWETSLKENPECKCEISLKSCGQRIHA